MAWYFIAWAMVSMHNSITQNLGNHIIKKENLSKLYRKLVCILNSDPCDVVDKITGTQFLKISVVLLSQWRCLLSSVKLLLMLFRTLVDRT